MEKRTSPENPEQRVAFKPGRAIKLLTPDSIGAVIRHPAHRANVSRVAALTNGLRSCTKPEDFYNFQRHLFAALYEVEEHRGQCSRVLKRLRSRQSLPVDSPELPPGSDPTKISTWEFEIYVYERLARQLRSVGDGLAWRCYGYDRRLILALSRNQSSGMMYGKDGLPHELGRVEQLWSDHRHFALLHGLTNCLRIADLSEFTAGGGVLGSVISS